MDLVVSAGQEGDAGTPGKVVDTDKEQYHRLAKLTQKYHAGKIPAIDWLDRLTFAEMERTVISCLLKSPLVSSCYVEE
jgi:hypothetical protein